MYLTIPDKGISSEVTIKFPSRRGIGTGAFAILLRRRGGGGGLPSQNLIEGGGGLSLRGGGWHGLGDAFVWMPLEVHEHLVSGQHYGTPPLSPPTPSMPMGLPRGGQ